MRISDWSSDVCSSDLLLCYVLLPLAGDYGSFVIIMGLFMMPIAAWSVSNPLALLLLAFALSTINLQGEYQPLEFGTFLEASFASLLGIYVGFFWLHMARRMGIGRASCWERVCQ